MAHGETTLTQLLADVGGTNTRAALARDGVFDRTSVKKLRNDQYQDLADVLRAYLEDCGAHPVQAAVAVAGPVRDGQGELTNLAWSFDETSLATATGVGRVHILNDLQAQGHGLGQPDQPALMPIMTGKAAQKPGQSRLVVGVGTGFNAAPVHETANGRLVLPSECGHVSLPQDSDEDRLLAKSLEREFGFASVEDALSGRGLETLYGWEGLGGSASKDSTAIMADLAQGDKQARATMAIFVRLLGATIGNLALIHLPFGGIFLIGGMARAASPYFDEFGFGAAMTGKGRFQPFLEEFPVSLVQDDFAALSGCAAFLESHI